MILVTGSSGQIGNVLVRLLHERKEEVVLMTKDGNKPAWLSHLDVGVRKGDLLNKDSIDAALDGAETVFHLAGMISISSYESKELYRVNVEGTQHVIDACMKHAVNRLVFTSSVHALPEAENGQAITEESNFDANKVFGAYSKTKAEATRRIMESVKAGLDAVVCFPSAVMGPLDHRGSEAGKLIRDYARNKLPVYIDGAYNFVDVRDVANGLLLAWQKGRKGEGYILSGEKMSLVEFFDILNDLHGPMRKPKFKMPLPIAMASARMLESTCRLMGFKPYFTSYAIKVLQSNCHLPSDKAQRELNYSYRPIRETIEDSLLWLKDNNKI